MTSAPKTATEPNLEEKLATAQLAHRVLHDYDGSGTLMGAIAEIWCEIHLGMSRAPRGEKDIDGILPNGRTLQVKAKKSGAHRDSATYITLREHHGADDVVVLFIDLEGQIARTIGPLECDSLKRRGNKGRCYVSDMVRLEAPGS